jgi:hypothetical protein
MPAGQNLRLDLRPIGQVVRDDEVGRVGPGGGRVAQSDLDLEAGHAELNDDRPGQKPLSETPIE